MFSALSTTFKHGISERKDKNGTRAYSAKLIASHPKTLSSMPRDLGRI